MSAIYTLLNKHNMELNSLIICVFMLLFNYKWRVVLSAEICYTNVTTMLQQPTSLSPPNVPVLPTSPQFSQPVNVSTPSVVLSTLMPPQLLSHNITKTNRRIAKNHQAFNANNKHSMYNVSDNDIVIGFLAGYGHAKVGSFYI